jgi:hypothetical protein
MSLLFQFAETDKMILDVIREAKISLIRDNVSPPYSVRLSPDAHDILIDEMRRVYRRKYIKISEVEGMKVEIDPLCPPQGAYIIGGGLR